MSKRVFPAVLLLFTLFISRLTCPEQGRREPEMQRLRNMGRAYYEEEKYEDALKVFTRCLALMPDSAIDEVNLGMVLVELGRYEDARNHLARGEQLDASLAPYACYSRAVTYKREKRFEDAAREFEKMRGLDPTCPDTAYNLAVVYESIGDIQKAFDELSRAAELAPDQIGPHYRRMIVAMRLGNKEVAIAERKIFLELRASDSRTRTPEELERSMYTEIIEKERGQPTPIAPVVKNPLKVRFRDVTAAVGLSSREAPDTILPKQPLCWTDIDGDARPDLLMVGIPSGDSLTLWKNCGEAGFRKTSAQTALLKQGMSALAVASGDLDHDGDNDLCVSSQAGIHLFFNQGEGKLVEAPEPITVAAGDKAVSFLLVDYDHEGDLDLYVATQSGAASMYRNNGKGTFEVVSQESGLSGDGTPATLLSFLDFDDDNDTDFFLAHAERPNQLLSSLRMGSFQDAADRVGLAQPANPRNVAVADINNDSWPDIVILSQSGEVVALKGKRLGKFQQCLLGKVDNPGQALTVLDYDNDGDEDVFVAGLLLQNDGVFTDVSESVGLAFDAPGGLAQAAPADFDGDGDLDLALCWRDGRLALLRNDGGNRNNWIRVTLEGLQTNRFGVATKVEVRDAAFFQRKICMGEPLLFGLGVRESLDVLRLWWPTGVAQNILAPTVRQTTQVREKLGPPSSCPFVYVWDGEKFSFLTDVLDGAALGVPLGNGTFLPYRSKEDLLIPGSRIRIKDGKLVIQLTGELRELVYLDSALLTAVGHASGSAVFPDECVGPPPMEKNRIHHVKNLRPSLSAKDHRANDLTSVLSRVDRRYADGFALTRFHGLAENHTLFLDFADTSTLKQPLLVLTGWIEWIDGDTLHALAQGAGPAPFGPLLEVQTADGRWERISENIGVPAGVDKSVIVELPPALCGEHARLRITTNQEIYWDCAALGDAASSPLEALPLKLLEADLHFRGFSKVVRGERGKPPWYDYAEVIMEAPYRPQEGYLTRYGDVLPLLVSADDRLVIFGPGDELTLTFSLPPELPTGQTRDFVLRLDGWIKDANPSTFAGDRVEPLPYRAMRGYPFGAEEGLPGDASYAEYLSLYNTRLLKREATTLRWSGIVQR